MELLKTILLVIFVSAMTSIVVQSIITISPHELRDDINGIPVRCYEVSFPLYPDPFRNHFHCKSVPSNTETPDDAG